MKQTIIIPDKTIKLSHGDKVEIYVTKKTVDFKFMVDGAGNILILDKKELLEMCK